jgi:DNA (cytosine-5)-methyltransferase 1
VRVLNAYAGIGGNRHLWPADWEVTAIELDEEIAAEYSRRYPHDTVLVEDAHAFVLEHAQEFDATWSSPPCPTHSRLAPSVAARLGTPLDPDPRLWAEIEHLRSLDGRHVVENVHVYYAPPIAPDLVTQRHWYWTSNPPLALTPLTGTNIVSKRSAMGIYAERYGLPPLPRSAVRDPRKVMRNAVVPLEGLQVALAAFALESVEGLTW